MPFKLVKPRAGKTPYFAVKGTYLGVRLDRSTKTGNRALAGKILKKWEREVERGELAEPGEPTFASAAAAYMKAGGERRFLRKLLEHLGDTKLSRIDQAAIDAAAASLYPSATGATRNRQVYSPICAVMRRAGIRLDFHRPHGSGGSKTTAWLWPEQAEAIFEEAGKIDQEFQALLIVLCYTGMRLSEALNLTWDNVRLADGFAYLAQTKNDEPRGVFFPSVAVAALAGLDQGTNRVFRFTKSGHLYHLLKAVAFKAGVELPQRSAFHIFRHTYATWLRRYAKADAKALVATGAWKDLKSVDRYTHVIVSEEAKLAALLPTPRKVG